MWAIKNPNSGMGVNSIAPVEDQESPILNSPHFQHIPKQPKDRITTYTDKVLLFEFFLEP